ncbi:MAG: T9SS C-terminal target domain-containing protein, partial [Haliscomenobacteraceae bacterium CHB4]|nr:T9SS C-terminal target domain-containing protein [Haliscomenobacteraceae bacterium CHB4]
DRTITHSRTISVNPAPQAAFTNLPGNIAIDCDEAPPSGTMLAYSNGQASACAISGSVTGQIAGSHNECGGSYSESWTFTDECGRATLHFRIISVNPAPAPAFVDPPGDITISCIQVPPAPTELNYTNGKTGACEISGSVLSEITGGLTVCGGSYRETWRLEDPCPDRPAIEYSREITVIDDTPPSGLCPSDIVVYCLDNIPCPDATDPELLGMIDMFETSYLDACGGVVTVSYSHASELQECSDPDGDGTYTFGRTFYFDISDDCGNTITCDVTYSGVCQPFCTFTQGFWGNPNGKANGLTSKQILEILLMPQQGGSITVGGGPNNCGFKVSTAQCILNILPAGGPSVPFSQNFQLNCNKQLKNTLAGQVLALSLNIRYNQHFNGLQLGTVVLSQSCVLTSSQITALGLNSNSTVNDLINLANKFLASPCNGTIYPNGFGGLLTNAVAALNEYWDECHVENNLCEAKSRVNESSENDSNMEDFAPFEDLNLSPNPASTVLRVAFTTDKSEVVYLRIFNLRGQLIKIIEFVAEEGENATEMDLAYLKSGIYWLNLANDETTIMKRFVVFRE